MSKILHLLARIKVPYLSQGSHTSQPGEGREEEGWREGERWREEEGWREGGDGKVWMGRLSRQSWERGKGEKRGKFGTNVANPINEDDIISDAKQIQLTNM